MASPNMSQAGMQSLAELEVEMMTDQLLDLLRAV